MIFFQLLCTLLDGLEVLENNVNFMVQIYVAVFFNIQYIQIELYPKFQKTE